jgi:hypothetical protein
VAGRESAAPAVSEAEIVPAVVVVLAASEESGLTGRAVALVRTDRVEE